MYKVSPHVILIGLNLAIASILLNKLFLPGQIIFGDFNYPLTLAAWLKQLSLWDPITQSYNVLSFQLYPVEGSMLWFASIFGLGSAVVEKSLLLGGIYASGISMYSVVFLYLRKWYPDSKLPVLLGAFIAGLIYSINPWILASLEEDSSIISYCAFPILFYLFDMAINSNRTKRFSLLFALVASFALMQQFVAMFMSLAIMWLIFSLVSGKASRLSILRNFFVTIILYILVDLFFLLPFIFGSGEVGTLLSYSNLISQSSKAINSFDQVSLLNVFELGGRLCCPPYPVNFFSMTGSTGYSSISRYSFLIVPILFAVSFFFRPRRAIVLFTQVSVIIYLLLATGTQSVISSLYVWLLDNVPFFGTFRESYLFAGIAIFPLGFACASGITEISSRILDHHNSSLVLNFRIHGLWKIASVVLLGVILGATYLTAVAPVAYAYGDTYYNPTPIPNEYNTVVNWVAAHAGNKGVLWIGQHFGSLTFWGGTHPMGPFETKSTNQPSLFYNSSPGSGNLYYYILYTLEYNMTTNLGRLLSPLDIGYVIFDNDTIGRYFPNVNYNAVYGSLTHQSDLKLSFSSGFLYVFQNTELLTGLSSSKGLQLIGGGYEVLTSLANQGYNTSSNSGIMLDQQMLGRSFVPMLEDSNLIILGPEDNTLNLLVQLLNRSDFITASKLVTNSTCWSLSSSYDVGGWHSIFQNSPDDLFDFDYGFGILMASCAGASAYYSLNLPKGEYVVLSRTLLSQGTNELSVSLGGSNIQRDINSSLTGLEWETMGNFSVSGESEVLTINSMEAPSAVNSIAVVPLEEYVSASKELSTLLLDKSILQLNSTASNNQTYNKILEGLGTGIDRNYTSNRNQVNGSQFTSSDISVGYPKNTSLIQTSIVYNTAWILSNNGEVCEAIPGYGMVNYYFLSTCGGENGTASLQFTPDKYFLIGVAISSATIIVALFPFALKRYYRKKVDLR
ncbi:MAG: hypothetical protein JRN20_14225 [Nitrososphaerota archaeon]|nr:hypothetical protein [Nitrososphaerota archaeon]